MKTIFTRLIITLIFFFASIITLKASHGTGGEMTWTCMGNGQYVFQVKFYRDCNGIPGSQAININTTVPGVPNIFAPIFSQTDISPEGFYQDGISPCPTCAGVGGGSAQPGIIEEYIYRSAPVTLNGVPPAQGWDFIWGECCRSGLVSNITGGGSIGFGLRAKMFSYSGQNADPCFDSSPYFIEKPVSILCTGLQVVYEQLSIDNEFDSLYYEFDTPTDDSGNPIPYSNGYSILNPIPGVTSLNSETGEFAFNTPLGGLFVLTIKVSAYKCGELVSEIRREINLSILNNCSPILGGVSNLAPEVAAPFIDQNTGLFTSYADTVMAGDTVNFDIVSYDFQNFNNGALQEVTISAFGQQYGANFTNTASGCLIPPCATLNPPPPVTNPASASTHFNWITTTAHLGYSFSCVQFLNTYYFINKAIDNYCPANGNNSRVFSITVLPTMPIPPVINNNGTLQCNLGSNFIYQWFLNRLAIPGANTFSFTPVQPGTYQVLAVAPDGQGNYSVGFNYNPLGLYENNFLSSCTISPNPSADGLFNISASVKSNDKTFITIYDVYGRIVFGLEKEFEKGTNSLTIDLSKLSSGVYNITFSNEKNQFSKYKVIKM